MYNGQLHISPELPCLNGHFPGRPILPAVATIDLALEWLCAESGFLLELEEVKNAKFTAPIEPGQDIRIEAEEVSAQEWQLDLSDESGRQLASLRLRLSGSSGNC